MPVPTSIKTRLLEIHRSGKYAILPPSELHDFYHLSHEFLSLNSSPSNLVPESEYYQLIELQFYLSLQTDHDIELKAMLQQLSDKFELSKSERLIVLKSVYIEATMGVDAALQYLDESKRFMARNPANLLMIRKRELVLHGRKDKDKKLYLENLINLSEVTPLDSSIWFEMSQVYYEQGDLDKLIHCLQEILLLQPFAYNIMAKLGELYYLNFHNILNKNGIPHQQLLDKLNENKHFAIKYFARSAELCSNYTRSWIGLYKATSVPEYKKNDSVVKDKQLNELALSNLKKLVSQDLVSERNKLFIKDIVNI